LSQPPVDALLLEEIAEHVASGVIIYVATRNSLLEPEATIAMGLKSDCARKLFTVYLPREAAARTLSNLSDNGAIAVTMTRPYDHKSIQIKGRAVATRAADDADRALMSVHRAALTEQFALVGVPRSITRRLTNWPSVAVDIEVNAAFLQTPGPRAGQPLRRG
jgi:hypothetical protein